jgi:allantoicase
VLQKNDPEQARAREPDFDGVLDELRYSTAISRGSIATAHYPGNSGGAWAI